jgi:hypothetical protein
MAVKNKDLEIIAEDLNTALDLNPPIDVSAKDSEVESQIITVGTDYVESGDVLKEETIQFLIDKGVELPDDITSLISTKEEVEEETKETVAGEKTKKTKATKAVKSKGVERTAYGSSVNSQAGKIDQVVLESKGKGIDASAIAEKLNLSKVRVNAHLKHLVANGHIKADAVKK